MTRYAIALALLAAAVLLLAACGDGDGGGTPAATLDPAAFTATVDNPFFPLVPGDTYVYEGEEEDPDSGDTITVRIQSTVLAETETVAGVEATAVEVKEYEDGELVEVTLDYYAQHSDGTVYYMGERVDEYDGGQVSGHGGQWLAGEGDNQAGVFMPAGPRVGDEFEQERAPGVAEDSSKVVSADETVETPAGAFSGCIKTEDLDPLSGITESKFYCPDAGLVREEGTGAFIELVSR